MKYPTKIFKTKTSKDVDWFEVYFDFGDMLIAVGGSESEPECGNIIKWQQERLTEKEK